MIQRPSTWWSPCAPRKLLNGSNGIVDQSLHLLQRLRTSNDLPVDQECRGYHARRTPVRPDAGSAGPQPHLQDASSTHGTLPCSGRVPLSIERSMMPPRSAGTHPQQPSRPDFSACGYGDAGASGAGPSNDSHRADVSHTDLDITPDSAQSLVIGDIWICVYTYCPSRCGCRVPRSVTGVTGPGKPRGERMRLCSSSVPFGMTSGHGLNL